MAVLKRVAEDNGLTRTELVEFLIGELRKMEPKEVQKWKKKNRKN